VKKKRRIKWGLKISNMIWRKLAWSIKKSKLMVIFLSLTLYILTVLNLDSKIESNGENT